MALARGVVSMSTTAMMGMGLIAIPTASASDPPMAWPIISPSRIGRTVLPDLTGRHDAQPLALQLGGQLAEHAGRGHVHERNRLAIEHNHADAVMPGRATAAQKPGHHHRGVIRLTRLG